MNVAALNLFHKSMLLSEKVSINRVEVLAGRFVIQTLPKDLIITTNQLYSVAVLAILIWKQKPPGVMKQALTPG